MNNSLMGGMSLTLFTPVLPEIIVDTAGQCTLQYLDAREKALDMRERLLDAREKDLAARMQAMADVVMKGSHATHGLSDHRPMVLGEKQ
jgi:hypothetical protein